MRASFSLILLAFLSSNAALFTFEKVRKSCLSISNSTGCECIIRRLPECCCMGSAIEHLPDHIPHDVAYLYLYNTGIVEVAPNFFENFTKIKELEIEGSPHIEHFDASCLGDLPNLRKLSITNCPNLLEISGKLLINNTKIQNLILRNNGIQTMPSLRMNDHHRTLDKIDLSHNKIKFIGDSKVRDVRARVLYLNHNHLLEISGYAFSGSQFVKLVLENNRGLSSISVDAFKKIRGLQELDLSHTSISVLPINGLKNLKVLKLEDVETLKRLPSVLSFTNLEHAYFTYPHHCCLFKYVDDVTMNENGKYQKYAKEIHKRVCNEKKDNKRRRTRTTEFNSNHFFEQLIAEWFENENFTMTIDSDVDDDLPPFTEIGAKTCHSVIEEVQRYYSNITCYPQPDHLNPCENIVGYPLLRIAIWVVCLAAIIGNIIVWILLALAYENRLKVHYLFMINMSVADMITGIYLAVLAIADAKMSDEYYRHAVWWQTGWGCRAAGFLAVFAAELGIISMFLIAFEMSYNTRQAIRGKRLGHRTGVLLMVAGWLFATFMAVLPWFGVSSYADTSVCLPLRAANFYDKGYLIFGLTFNFLAFVAMSVSYGFIVKMLKENETRNEDKAIITKMSLLVGTDLVCWFPTLFFGFTAAIGFPLISISNAKFVLVFFFPINAFANPFLYVFFTKVIQNRVKTKTLPVIRRITTTPLKNASSLSNFYNSQPPGAPRRSASGCLPGSSMHLGVTQVGQTTSISSTPRGSNVSRASDAMLYDSSPSPRVSFDLPSTTSVQRLDSQNPYHYNRQISLLRRIVSAIPEVSDLSEHSSESDHEHVPTQRRRIRSSLSRILALVYRNSSSQDSGRGSLASDRSSLTGGERAQLENSSERPKIILPPSADGRRKSTPAIPLLRLAR